MGIEGMGEGLVEGIAVAGDALTVAALQKEVEGSNGSQGAHASVHGNCANCGAALNGHYCHQCGQSAHIHRSLLHMFEEFLHGIFHFDTKAWRTIPSLIWHPGKLTREYIAGKRTSYVSPLALFLFLNFLMFFVFSYTMGDHNVVKKSTPQEKAKLVKVLEKNRSELAKLEAEIKLTYQF